MRVKFLTSLVGHGWSRSAGEVADVDDAEAARLVAVGYALPVAKAKGKPAAKAVEPDLTDIETADDLEAK